MLSAWWRHRPLTRHATPCLSLAVGVLILGLPGSAHADSYGTPRTTYGTIGHIEMPSARMAPDGQLSISATYYKNTQRYNLGFQILPWLETSFRYSGLARYQPLYPVYYDRSFSFKARLFEEGSFFPAVAIGVNDIVGTGVYGGEYLAFSKRLYAGVDATVGIGWGRMGTAATMSNPLRIFDDSIQERETFSDAGGTNFGSLFRGATIGFFGGLNWQTPLEGLTLSVEYSSDGYVSERAVNNFRPDTQFNFGISYRPIESVELRGYYLYGASLGGSITFEFDPVENYFPTTIGPQPLEPVIRAEAQQQNALALSVQQSPRQPRRPAPQPPRKASGDFVEELYAKNDVTDVTISGGTLTMSVARRNLAPRECQSYARLAQNYPVGLNKIVMKDVEDSFVSCDVPTSNLLAQAEPAAAPIQSIGLSSYSAPVPTANPVKSIQKAAQQQRLSVTSVVLGQSDATVYYENSQYLLESEAVGRLVRVLMMYAPPNIERFHLVSINKSLPIQTIDVLRSSIERNIQQDILLEGVSGAVAVRPAPLNAIAHQKYPRVSWSIGPDVQTSLFDPADPLAFLVFAAASGSVELFKGFSVTAGLEANVINTSSSSRTSDSELPHVRSDFPEYFRNGLNGIAQLKAEYRFKAAPDVFVAVKGGYLESMFAGAGGEILWRPAGARWALGANVYQVWQREFDRLFGLQNYETITGHVTLYYESPWHGLNFALRTGKYLAGDYGSTLRVTRRFSTGVEIGAFATVTNVSAKRFGEGSFDKGLIIRIPLGWSLPVDSQNEINLEIRPTQRDGGQTLYGDATLYEETRRASFGAIFDNLDRITSP